MPHKKLTIIFFLLSILPGTQASPLVNSWEYIDGSLKFSWDLNADRAKVTNTLKAATVWEGSLLPSFWILDQKGNKLYVHAQVDLKISVIEPDRLNLVLLLGEWGKGELIIEKKDWGISFTRLRIQWASQVPAIIEMYFGSSPLKKNGLVHPLSDHPFKPDWQAAGFCVPGAKGGTVQSFFRSWDFGQADISLGNFGPSLGTPYGAAFPRPFLFAAMGSNAGWISLGSGSIPDAALSLKIQSTKGCFKYLYREDLWGASTSNIRTWEEPLRISLAISALDAFGKYYASFPGKKNTIAPKPLWNTWGMWRLRKFPMKPLTDFADKLKAEIFVLDDSWESSQGSGKPNLTRFPDFQKDLDQVRNRKMEIGVWETVGWISDTIPYGLGSSDLIVDQEGLPCKTNWNFDDEGESYYCLDISSPRVKAFLRKRTIATMESMHPSLLKLDFGYALPSPNMGVPRDPANRGERYSFELIKIISDAAKTVDPNVIVMNYGISPLWFSVTDMISLDDQGDLWYELHRGHQEWSIWASLLGNSGVAITGSSSYNWNDDAEVLLNSAIIGVPAASLALALDEGKEIPESFINRRYALDKFCRRTVLWKPRWFNSRKGDLDGPPKLNCWGREEIFNNKKVLTALALREGDRESIKDSILLKARWSGDWCLIAQDNRDVMSSAQLAVIPFAAGKISIPFWKRPNKIIRENVDGPSPFTDWSWDRGILTLNIPHSIFGKTGGLVVYAD